MTWNMIRSRALKILSFCDGLQMLDAPLLVNGNLNGKAYKIVVLIFPYLSILSPVDVVHSVEPISFSLNEFFVSNHNDPTLIYGCDCECDCYNPRNHRNKQQVYRQSIERLGNNNKIIFTLNVALSIRQCTQKSRTNFFRFSLSSPFFTDSVSSSSDLSTCISSTSFVASATASSTDSPVIFSSFSMPPSVDGFLTVFFLSDSFSTSDLESVSSVFDLSSFSLSSPSPVTFFLAETVAVAAGSRFFSELNALVLKKLNYLFLDI